MIEDPVIPQFVADIDKKKKRRHRRHSKHISPLSGQVCASVNESQSDCIDRESLLVPPTSTTCNSPVTYYSKAVDNVQSLPASQQHDLIDAQALQNKYEGLTSIPGPISNPYVSKDLSTGAGKIFIPHWSLESAMKAVEEGRVFKGVFRVNAHNRFEAYCKIDGVPVDILINGLGAQNRAVDGDIVAIQVDPLSCWTRMKGSPKHSVASVLAERSALAASVSERDDMGIVEHGMGSMNISREAFSETKQDEGLISQLSSTDEKKEVPEFMQNICYKISLYPLKRPTGKVVAILEKSSRRDSVIGHLSAKKYLEHLDMCKRYSRKNSLPLSDIDYIELMPTDPKFSKMIVPIKDLPNNIQKRLLCWDATLEMEIVAAKLDCWQEDDPFPRAQIVSSFGRAGEIETHVASILFENDICSSEFSAESLSCLPDAPWSVPQEELENRRDIRNKCIFTIDPPTATDLDDALSFENLSNGNFRVGVHISDVSYFVLPDSALDKEAQERSTSVYMLQQKVPMLPPLLSEDIGSLNPGVDRLAFSIFWEISPEGTVISRWLGRTVICSCCKLSYAHAQDIIDSEYPDTAAYPSLHCQVEWPVVIKAVKNLHEISKKLKEKRFINGALRLDGPKLTYLFDDFGIPYDGIMSERYDANFLVEEFMLLANRTAAEVISRAYPDNALLRRHPEPNMRKLKEFEAFCCKNGLDVNICSSGQLHQSLERIKQEIRDDTLLFNIIVNYATKPMQLALYFCSGDQKIPVHDWGHYALSIPLYTHFTSPLRRYPDIMVHRTLAAVIDAEHLYSKHHPSSTKGNAVVMRCFTGTSFDKSAADSKWGQEALFSAALKHKVPHGELLVDVASHFNKRKVACKSAQNACHRLYMWILLKNKMLLVSDARVLGLGPKFMSIYVQKLAIETRIYYDDVEGLTAEWLEATSTLVLSLNHKRINRKGMPNRWRPLEDVALVVNPVGNEQGYQMNAEDNICATSLGTFSGNSQNRSSISGSDIEPHLLPLTIHMFSTIPVALCAVGGEDGPLDIVAKLFLSSYFG